MKITTDHKASRYGMPVMLDARGRVMGYADGLKAIRAKLAMSTEQIAEACGVSRRTVEGWEQGRRRIPTEALNVMASLL